MIPVLLPRSWGSRSYESGQNAGRRVGQHRTVAATKVDKMPVGFADVMVSSLKAGIRAWLLSLRPLGPRAAWAQPGTGPPDAEDGHGRSCGRGCVGHAASSPAALGSTSAIPASPSPGDWSVDSLRWRFSSRSSCLWASHGPGPAVQCERSRRWA